VIKSLLSLPAYFASLPMNEEARTYARDIKYMLKKGRIKEAYNYLHYLTFWGMKDNHFIAKLSQMRTPYPSYTEIEVTTRCNLRCIMCEHTYWNEETRDMSFETFKKIVDGFPNLKWIGLTGIGESFLNKDFLKMLRYVKSKSVYVELYDTFFFIDEKTARELIEIGVDLILASIDGATKETYEKIRRGSDFERVINNVKTLVELKREMNSYFPRLGFHYIISTINLKEIPHYIEMVHSICGDQKTEILFSRVLHEFDEIQDIFTQVPDKIVLEATKLAKELGILIRLGRDVPKTKPPVTQCVAWTMPFIFVTGHVVPCCVTNEANRRDFQKRHNLGNVFERNFNEIWHSRNYTNFREMIRAGKVPVQCIKCPIFEVDKKN